MSKIEVTDDFVNEALSQSVWGELQVEAKPLVEETTDEVIEESFEEEEEVAEVIEEEESDGYDLIVRRLVNEDTEETTFSLELSESELEAGVLTEDRAVQFMEFLASEDDYDLVSADSEE